jgi:hypothetical protein
LGVQRVLLEGLGSRLMASLCAAMALMLMTAPTPLWGAVYQCNGPDGSTVFSDSPCGTDAKVIIVRPQPPMSNTTAATAAKRSSTTSAGRGKTGTSDGQSARDATRDADALKCQAREYGAWYQAQNPKPSREQSDAKMSQIVDSCWLATHILSAQDNVAVSPNVQTVIRRAPQVSGGSAGMASAPAGAGTPLQVSRSRQPEEAARWNNYYTCRSTAYQNWSNGLGHAPDDAETREAQARTDMQCRAQYSIPSGAAAILAD